MESNLINILTAISVIATAGGTWIGFKSHKQTLLEKQKEEAEFNEQAHSQISKAVQDLDKQLSVKVTELKGEITNMETKYESLKEDVTDIRLRLNSIDNKQEKILTILEKNLPKITG